MNESELIWSLTKDSARNEFTMIDVGGHHGSSCVPFARQGARVLAFEPDAKNREVLLTAVAGFENVTIDERAVGERDIDSAPWYQSDLSTGISGLSAFHDSHREASDVRVSTLKSVLAEQEIGRVDYLKIDTEGHDLMVLRGFDWDTERLHPRFILTEFEDAKTIQHGYDWKDLANYLADKGYHVLVSEWRPIVRYGTTHQWRQFAKFPCELLDSNAWGNLVAFRDRPDYEAGLRIAEQLRREESSTVVQLKKQLYRRIKLPLVRLWNFLGRHSNAGQTCENDQDR